MDIKEILLQYVSSVIEDKRNSHIEPLNATFNEVMDKINGEVRTGLNSLIREKRLKWSPNINGIPLFTLPQD